MRKIGFLLVALAVVSSPARATTVIPVADGDLVDRSPFIVSGTVSARAHVEIEGRPFTEYELRLERSLKGSLAAGSTARVRVLGGSRADGLTLQIWGAPDFAVGDRALLFLVPHPDGGYRPFQVVLGHFRERVVGGRRLWVRDLSGVEVIGGQGRAAEARDFDRFPAWIAARAAGLLLPPEAPVEVSAGELAAAGPKFTFLGGTRKRWFEFDNQTDVTWLADSTGQPGLSGGGFSQFAAAAAAWNHDPNTHIRYRYGQPINLFNGFTFDGINLISFRDWSSDIGSDFVCVAPGIGSGVLAVGGPWFMLGPEPMPILEADIVINDGAGCWFNNNGKRAEGVYGHARHTLGLGHSCGDDQAGPCDTPDETEALMRADAHSDDRGAALAADDRAGIRALYPGVFEGATRFHTVAPCRLADTRNPDSLTGGPVLAGTTFRTFPVTGRCGIPVTARSVVVNVTAILPTAAGHLRLFPSGNPLPNASTLNFQAGQVRAAFAVAALGPDGQLSVWNDAIGPVHMALDATGYFAP